MKNLTFGKSYCNSAIYFLSNEFLMCYNISSSRFTIFSSPSFNVLNANNDPLNLVKITMTGVLPKRFLRQSKCSSLVVPVTISKRKIGTIEKTSDFIKSLILFYSAVSSKPGISVMLKL